MAPTQWLSARQAAEAMDPPVTQPTMNRLLNRGLIQGAVQVDGRWLIPAPVVRLKAPRGPKNRPGVETESNDQEDSNGTELHSQD